MLWLLRMARPWRAGIPDTQRAAHQSRARGARENCQMHHTTCDPELRLQVEL